jgi:hypothetical protein
VDPRLQIRKDEAVGAQLKPDTVSVGDPVKFLPVGGVDKSLGMSLQPGLEGFLSRLRRDIITLGLSPLVIILRSLEKTRNGI